MAMVRRSQIRWSMRVRATHTLHVHVHTGTGLVYIVSQATPPRARRGVLCGVHVLCDAIRTSGAVGSRFG